MAEPTSIEEAEAAHDKNQYQTVEDAFFSQSPLKSNYYVQTITNFVEDTAKIRTRMSFAKGYVRLKNDKSNALYFFNDTNTLGLQLDVTKEQLQAFDEIVEAPTEPTLLTPKSLRAIHQLLNYVPEEKYFEQPSLIAHIKSLGLVDEPPVHVLMFKIKPLLRTNPALFKFLTIAQRNALATDLRIAFYQLCARYQMEDTKNQQSNLNSYIANIERCAFLLRHLELSDEERLLETHKKETQNSAAGQKKWYHEQIKLMEAFYLDFSAGKTVYLTRWMSELNTWRSYFSWASLTLHTALNFIPRNFYNVQQTIDATTDPQESLRILGCILYYVRFLINFVLILKHTIKGPWMSEEEKKLIDKKGGSWNQLTERLAAEKFGLINDLVWGTNNLVNILWLLKSGLGTYGDILAMCVMTLDVFLGKCAADEAEKKHQQEIQFYNNEIIRLKEKRHEDEQHDIIKIQLNRLLRARDLCEDHWQRQTKDRKAEIYYSAGVAVGFITIIFPWAEIGAEASSAGLIMGATGFCFALALLYSGYKAYTQVTNARDTRLSALEECHAILSSEGPLNEADYIRYKDLFAEAEHQAKLEKYQLYVFIRSVIIQSIIPIAVFAGFTFSTFGVGVAAFAIVIAASILTHYALKYFKPEEAALTQFEENEYCAFNKDKEKTNIDSEIKQMKSKDIVGLFSHRQENDLNPDNAIDSSLAK